MAGVGPRPDRGRSIQSPGQPRRRRPRPRPPPDPPHAAVEPTAGWDGRVTTNEHRAAGPLDSKHDADQGGDGPREGGGFVSGKELLPPYRLSPRLASAPAPACTCHPCPPPGR